MIESYVRHNQSVLDYFKFRPDDLLVLNVGDKSAYKQLCEFIGVEPLRESFPRENITKNIEL